MNNFVLRISNPLIYGEAKLNGKFIRTFRTPEISTSSIIQRVVRNREKFILALVKRGYSLKKLRVSKVYYCIIKLKSCFKKLFQCGGKKKKQATETRIDRGVIYKSEI